MSNPESKNNPVFNDLELFINKQAEIIELFKEGIDNPYIAIFFLNHNFEYLHFNQTHKQAIKNAYGQEIRIGKNFFDFFPENEKSKFKPDFERALAGEPCFSSFRFGPGEYKLQQSTIHPIRAANHAITGIAVYSINKMFPVRPEKTTAESFQDFRMVMDNFPYELVILSPDFKILYLNKQALARIQKKLTEVEGQHLFDVDDTGITALTQPLINEICAGEQKSVHFKPDDKKGRIMKISYIPVASENGKIREIFRILIDVTEISKNENRLRALSNQLEKMREEERHRISRDIHDDLGQILTALKIDLVSLQKKSGTGTQLHETLAPIVGLVDAAIDSARRVSFELRPGILDQTGLIPAVEWLINQSKKHTAIEYQVSLPDTGILEIDTEKSVAVYRILQEILTNISRHAQASRVAVALTADKNQVKLVVTDNGKCFDFDSHAESLGILGMQERARMQHGKLDVQTRPTEGTVITLTIPVREIF